MVSPVTNQDHLDRATLTRRLFDEAGRADARHRQATLERVVLTNRPVAESVARRFHGRGIDPADLRQVAYEGLVKAVHRFDPERGKDFLTFAVPTMRGEIQRHFRDHGWMVRPTRSVQESHGELARAEDRLAQELGRHPSPDEVRRELDLTPEQYDAATGAAGCFRPTSLDAPPPGHRGEGAALADLLHDDTDDGPAAEARIILAPAVRRLPSRARKVLYLRYYEGLTQGEIGETIGVNQTQVSRILTGVLTTLRSEIGALEPVPDEVGYPLSA